MNIKLAPELEVLVEQKVSSGQYPSAHRVVEVALILLDERDRQTQQLRAEIMLGIEQLERGEFCDGEEFLQGLLHELELAESV